jgi:hypothetical protein
MSWKPVSAVAHAVYESGFEYVPALDIIKSRLNAWQRYMGYCWAYDIGAPPASMIIDCEPFYFDYDGKRWMIELWKGQYGLETGAEIGLYHAPPNGKIGDQMRFFSCASGSDLLNMQFELSQGDKLLFKRGPERHWWLTGFKWGVFTKDPSDLTMKLQIDGFPSQEMRDSFADSVRAKHYSVVLTGDPRGIRFAFDVPHTPQPASRALASLAQKNNEWLVNLYNAYKSSQGFTNNDPNNFTEIEKAAGRVMQAVSTAEAILHTTFLGAFALDSASAIVAKLRAVLPAEVDPVTAYHTIHNLLQKGRRTWHGGTRSGG